MSAAAVGTGVPAALAAGPLLESLLYDVAPRDPLMVAAASATMVAVAAAAGCLPARRASRLDAMAALRED